MLARVTCLWLCCTSTTLGAEAKMALFRDDGSGRLTLKIEGQEALVYQYADALDTPHFWPVRSPSGKLLTERHPPLDKYPHHRSFWISDKVQLRGQPVVDFYHSWKNQANKHDPNSPFNHRIKHCDFTRAEVQGNKALIGMKLVWEIDRKTPVLDQSCNLVVHSLEKGQYLIDLSFQLTATFGDLLFDSDAVHYAWPYVRMHPQFSGDRGGTIVNDKGQFGETPVTNQVARWVDYSNTVDGKTEGITVFSHPSNGTHNWLARAYGTWGPRRTDKLNGTRFTLKRGESIAGRFGIFVHCGDAISGKVADRYLDYLKMAGE